MILNLFFLFLPPVLKMHEIKPWRVVEFRLQNDC